jgi:hypothetical protein
MGFLKNLLGNSSTDFTKVENSQRFNFMLQQMQSNRWKITLIILLTFFFIIFGIVLSVMFKASIQESWKELLLLLLGAFVGNLNKVIDYWFSNEDRDKMLVQKMDEEDGITLSDTGIGGGIPSIPLPTNQVNNLGGSQNRVEVDEDGDGVMDGYDTDGDGTIDEYFPHRNCQHVWGDADGDGDEECLVCGQIKPIEEN